MRHRFGTARATALICLCLLLGSTAALAQTPWTWQGQLPQGQTIEIIGISGDIRVIPSGTAGVRVTAHRTARRGNPDDVRVEVVEHGGGVTICAVYPSPPDSANACRPGGGSQRVEDSSVRVAFSVELPAGVNLAARTVLGDIEATDLASDVTARTVNGSIRIATSGTALANTVNGAIDVTMGRSDWSDAASYQTVNGNITLRVAGDLNAQLRASTVNGTIHSDYPMTVQGDIGRRRVNGTIGAGGPDLRMTTVNGDISIRRQ